MAKETEIEIGEVTYRVVALKPRKAARIGIRLTRLLGKPIGSLAGALEGLELKEGQSILDVDVSSLDLGAIDRAIKTLLMDLTEETFDKLLVDLFDKDRITYYTEERGWKPVGTVDTHFDKFDFEHMLDFMGRLVWFNYGPLLKKLWGLVGKDGDDSKPKTLTAVTD